MPQTLHAPLEARDGLKFAPLTCIFKLIHFGGIQLVSLPWGHDEKAIQMKNISINHHTVASSQDNWIFFVSF